MPIIQLNDEELRNLQVIELEMLVEVDRICRKNGIKYSLDGGTLLGAIRHKGFIPWDDDIDVMFLHDEYEKFYEACKTDLDTNRFFFQDHRTDPGYRWGYGKLRRLGTEYIKLGQERLKQKTGICIDLFDIENIPDGYLDRKVFLAKMFCIRKILYSAVGKYSGKNFLLRLWYSLISLIPSDFAHMYRNKLIEKYNNANTLEVQCGMFPVCKYGFPKSLFADYVEVEFEGMTFFALKGYDKLLRMQYGDYMQLPPPNERKGVMDAIKYKFINISLSDVISQWKEG